MQLNDTPQKAYSPPQPRENLRLFVPIRKRIATGCRPNNGIIAPRREPRGMNKFKTPFLFVLWIPLFLMVFASGCRRNGESSGESTLNVAVSVEVASLDPQITTSIAAIKIQSALFRTLVKVDSQTGAILPSGASAWEVSESGTLYRFELDENGKWSDGAPLVASDYVFSFSRLLTQKLGAPFASLYFDIAGAVGFYESLDPDPSTLGVRAVSERVLEIRLSKPVPFFLSLLARPCVAALPSHYGKLKKQMTSRISGWALEPGFPCSGPYRLKEWRVNQHILVERNPTYEAFENLAFDEICFYPIPSVYAQERGFLAGQLDVTSSLASERVQSYKDRAEFMNQFEMGTFYVITNTAGAVLNSREARQSLNRSIDRRAIVDQLRQRGETPANGFSPPLWSQYSPEVELLENSGGTPANWPGNVGRKLRFLISSSEGNLLIAEALQTMWQDRLGVEIEIVRQEWKSYLDSRKRGEFDLCLATWIGDYFDPLTFLEMWQSNAINNYCNWSNAAYDRLLTEAAYLTDEIERFSNLQTAEELLMREAPILPVFYLSRVYLKSQKLENWPQTILNTVNYESIER